MTDLPDTFAELCARFAPAQLNAVDERVAAADDFTDDQLAELAPYFAGAGERLATQRQVEPGTAA